MKPKVLIGNIFESKSKTLVNTVNTVGIMGKGIAQEFKNRFPEMYVQYKLDCDAGIVKIGEPIMYRDLLGNSIINFPTKEHWKSPSLLKNIEKGLNVFVNEYKNWDIDSIAFPPLGCGNGGLAWDDVGPLMYQKLSNLDIPVEIYAPFGTNAEKLKEEFLESPRDFKQIRGSTYKNTQTLGTLAAIEVLSRLENQKYTKPIGRVIFQKIYYVLTSLSVDTGLHFTKASYGPFSSDLKQVLHTFANQNLIQEKQYNNMMLQTVGNEYYNVKKNYEQDLSKWETQISKTVDLFSRIKDTDQAEEVATILFATNKILEDNHKVYKEDILEYVMNWKKAWNDKSKIKSIEESIENLESLDWLRLEHENVQM